MSSTLLVMTGLVLFALVTVITYFIVIYNGLVTVKENIKKAWANIDVVLKQRYDELPKLISVCESYAEFEKGILDRVMKARENYFRAGSVQQKAKASAEISGGLKSLFALAESFPQLKANENFMQLQQRISHLEESIADRREFYNDSVNNYNIRIQQIPDTLVATMLGYRKEDMFQVSEAERKDVEIKIKLPKF
jgi:LemA protein